MANNTMAKEKRTSNDQQNTTTKSKDWAVQNKTGGTPENMVLWRI
jgi:hypothetical protein